ncbi:uncharacterized protein AB675_12148 [Cyphellophora attinorum]|uniref:Polymerase/histidinol phosphatase N-terminal domain-containing protein n=1 Tax=Cyphellophora attinorum TaxID=1664694 RepID=A0A0N1NZE7_9EURO|nr:uncharacterized protein AB675_12148 [Phialophora attinorum]KPI38254.1 hypothetical protein AB675_12148 [Phialophora attinorum]
MSLLLALTARLIACLAILQFTTAYIVTHNLTGDIPSSAVMNFVYAPFPAPQQQHRSRHLLSTRNLPISAFNGSGSRGWSGGFRKNFTIALGGATPGYNAGPLEVGEWNVVLGPYVVEAAGVDWSVNVEVTYAKAEGDGMDWEGVEYWRPTLGQSSDMEGAVRESEEQWLRGDFHMHSIYSDGRYLPSEQMENAVKKGLDFIFFSEHNTDSGSNEIGRWRPEGAEELLVGRAIEVTTRHGHWQAIGLDRGQQVEWRYTNETDGFAQAADGVRQSGALVSINHPYASCSRCDWTLDWDHHDAIEVWNGRWSPLNELAVRRWQDELVAGKKTVAIGGSDAHHPPEQNGLPTTVVRTSVKSQAGIVQGVREGGVYLVEGPGMELEFSVLVDGIEYDIGRTAPTGSGTAVLAARGFLDAIACFVTDTGYVKNQSLTEDPVRYEVDDSRFIRVEVRNSSDVLLGLANPVFFE